MTRSPDPRLLYLALSIQQSQHRHNLDPARPAARHAELLRLAEAMTPEQMADIRAAMDAADRVAALPAGS